MRTYDDNRTMNPEERVLAGALAMIILALAAGLGLALLACEGGISP